MKPSQIAGLMLLLLLVGMATLPGEVAACPTCKAGMEGESHGGLAEGFYWSILFVMSMPFLILGGLSLLFYLSIRKAQRAAAWAQTEVASQV